MQIYWQVKSLISEQNSYSFNKYSIILGSQEMTVTHSVEVEMNPYIDCFMCEDPMFTGKEGLFVQKIADLRVSTAILNRDWQFFEGSALLVYREHITELNHLDSTERHLFMDDACRLADALEQAYPGIKLNHGLFGNTLKQKTYIYIYTYM